MVGGDADVLEAARPALEPFAGLIVHVGGPGMGQVVKLCNNLIYAAQMLATRRGDRDGGEGGGRPAQAARGLDAVDAATATRCARGSRSRACVPDSPASNDWKPGFMTDLMAKDLDLAIALRGAARTRRCSRRASCARCSAPRAPPGYGREDFSSLGKVVRELAG